MNDRLIDRAVSQNATIARRYWLLGAASQNPVHFETLRQFDASRIARANARMAASDHDLRDDLIVEVPSGLAYYDKLLIAVKAWLDGAVSENPDYRLARMAFRFGARYHTGVRKDGKTPEYQHQVQIALAVRNHLKDLLSPVETLALVFLHDVVEDYGVPLAKIRRRFGDKVADAVDRISKIVDGKKKSRKVYFRGLSGCPISSVAKGFDREHNMESMFGVFDAPKIGRYTDEVIKHFFDMLKTARLNFPEQDGIYESLKNQLEAQVRGAQAFLLEHEIRLKSTPTPTDATAMVHAHR